MTLYGSSTLYSDEVIALLNNKFVPYMGHWGQKKEPGLDSWRKLISDKFKPGGGIDGRLLKGTPFLVVSSAGHPLGGSGVPGNPAAGLKSVLEAYAKLPEAKRRPGQAIKDPDHPLPAPPPGGLVLTVYDRVLPRDRKSDYTHIPRTKLAKPIGNGRYVETNWREANEDPGKPFVIGVPPGAQRNSFWLKEAEWRGLIPKAPQVDQSYPLPQRLTHRLCLYGLWCNAMWTGGRPWGGDSIRHADLKLTVAETTAQALHLRIHGRVLLQETARLTGESAPDGKKQFERFQIPSRDAETRYDLGLEGMIVYDLANKRITRWDMVALGDYSGKIAIGGHMSPVTPRIPYGHVFELDQSDYDAPAEFRRPKPFVLVYTFAAKPDYYWFPEKYQADWKKHNKR